MEDPSKLDPTRLFLFAVQACVILLLFGGKPLADWAGNLAPSPVADSLVAATQAWDGVTDRIGLDLPYVVLRREMQVVREVRFGS
jgi:hypothetical protein